MHRVKRYLVMNKKLSRSASECIFACRSSRIQASISSARGLLAPTMNVESDIVREKIHGKQIGTRLGTRPSAYHDVTGIYRHIPPGHANKCSQYIIIIILPPEQNNRCTHNVLNVGVSLFIWGAQHIHTHSRISRVLQTISRTREQVDATLKNRRRAQFWVIQV